MNGCFTALSGAAARPRARPREWGDLPGFAFRSHERGAVSVLAPFGGIPGARPSAMTRAAGLFSQGVHGSFGDVGDVSSGYRAWWFGSGGTSRSCNGKSTSWKKRSTMTGGRFGTVGRGAKPSGIVCRYGARRGRCVAFLCFAVAGGLGAVCCLSAARYCFGYDRR